MESYDKFLKIIKDGWEGTIISTDIEKQNPHTSLMWPALEHNPQKLLLQQRKANRIKDRLKVNNEGITIQIISNSNIIKIDWDNILRVSIDDSFSPIESKEILIELKDGKKIIISPPFIKRVLIKRYWINEFIDYINNHICIKIDKN